MSDSLMSAAGKILEGRLGLDRALKRSEILSYLQELPLYCETTDRMVRGAIEDLRQAGWMICNMANDSGYFLAESSQEYQEFRRLYVSYATTILSRVRAMDKTAENKWGATALLQDKLFTI
jgi:hypothetical protein